MLERERERESEWNEIEQCIKVGRQARAVPRCRLRGGGLKVWQFQNEHPHSVKVDVYRVAS